MIRTHTLDPISEVKWVIKLRKFNQPFCYGAYNASNADFSLGDIVIIKNDIGAEELKYKIMSIRWDSTEKTCILVVKDME